MLNDDEKFIFFIKSQKKHYKELSEISKGDHHPIPVMNSVFKMYDFDKICQNCSAFKGDNVPSKTTDALYYQKTSEGLEIYFIEFKGDKLDKKPLTRSFNNFMYKYKKARNFELLAILKAKISAINPKSLEILLFNKINEHVQDNSLKVKLLEKVRYLNESELKDILLEQIDESFDNLSSKRYDIHTFLEDELYYIIQNTALEIFQEYFDSFKEFQEDFYNDFSRSINEEWEDNIEIFKYHQFKNIKKIRDKYADDLLIGLRMKPIESLFVSLPIIYEEFFKNHPECKDKYYIEDFSSFVRNCKKYLWVIPVSCAASNNGNSNTDEIDLQTFEFRRRFDNRHLGIGVLLQGQDEEVEINQDSYEYILDMAYKNYVKAGMFTDYKIEDPNMFDLIINQNFTVERPYNC